MIDAALFPDAWADGVDGRIDRAWDRTADLPVPRFVPTCPSCHTRMVVKHWKFHRRTGTPTPYRCDVAVKCIGCSLVLAYGIPVDRDTYDRGTAMQAADGRVSWRTGRDYLRRVR